MSFFLRAPRLQSLKQTTGIVGLEVIPNGRQVLGDLVRKVLFDVRASFPEMRATARWWSKPTNTG